MIGSQPASQSHPYVGAPVRDGRSCPAWSQVSPLYVHVSGRRRCAKNRNSRLGETLAHVAVPQSRHRRSAGGRRRYTSRHETDSRGCPRSRREASISSPSHKAVSGTLNPPAVRPVQSTSPPCPVSAAPRGDGGRRESTRPAAGPRRPTWSNGPLRLGVWWRWDLNPRRLAPYTLSSSTRPYPGGSCAASRLAPSPRATLNGQRQT